MLLALVSYVLISTFTPGPSNISTASLGILHGYKNTLRYQAGLAVVVFVVMLLSGWISMMLLQLFPALEVVLRWVGAAYILYLAFGVLKASYTFTAKDAKPLGFAQGVVLQALNPKLMVYAFTVFSVFLAPIVNNLALVAVAAFVLAMVSFAATSVWALFGTSIKTYLRNPRLIQIVNVVLALSLVYTAVTLLI